MNTFNIGDRVIVLEGSRPDFVGKVGEVTSVERITGDRWYWKSSDHYLYGLMCDDGRPRNGFGVENLALTDILPPQATPQPQPATAPTAGGAGDGDPWIKITLLEADLATLRAENSRLVSELAAVARAALVFYADEARYKLHPVKGNPSVVMVPIDEDSGEKARQTLKALKS